MPSMRDAWCPVGRPTLVLIGESDRNLFALGSAMSEADWLWIVPEPVGRDASPGSVGKARAYGRWDPSDCSRYASWSECKTNASSIHARGDDTGADEDVECRAVASSRLTQADPFRDVVKTLAITDR